MLEIFWIFLRLGLTSFGGPVAHIGYFRAEFVARRRWLDEEAYGAIVSFCQFLPGPASSQVAMTLGLTRAGLGGLLAAWLGFTLPSALLMILFALFLDGLGGAAYAPWVHGLKIATVAIVAQALWDMARILTPDLLRLACAVLAAAIALLLPTEFGQLVAIALGGLLGWMLMKPRLMPSAPDLRIPLLLSWSALALFFLLLAALPVLAAQGRGWALFDADYRAGALLKTRLGQVGRPSQCHHHGVDTVVQRGGKPAVQHARVERLARESDHSHARAVCGDPLCQPLLLSFVETFDRPDHQGAGAQLGNVNRLVRRPPRQRLSGAPLMKIALPLSARIIPYLLRATRITRDSPVKRERSKFALRRSRSPIGGRFGSVLDDA